MNREKVQRIAIELLAGAFTAALLLAQIPAAALPGMVLGAARPVAERPVTEDPRSIVGQGFEELLGRQLNRQEQLQVNVALEKIGQVDERPQKASFVTDAWDRYEKLPIICIYGKANGKIPLTMKNFSLNGVSASYEITPCLVLNSFNPLGLRLREFKSYIMQGGSFNQTGGQYGGVSGGIVGGIYAGPKNLAKPLIGTYGFARLTADRGLGKIVGQVAYSNHGQVLAMAGVGGELSFDAILRALKVLPKVDGTSASVAGIKGEIGMYFDVKEFPWFERLVLKRMNPIDAFADMAQYIAANN